MTARAAAAATAPTARTAPVGLWTLGHGTLAADALAALLTDARVASLVDIRIGPGSRRNPHLARAAMEQWLPEAGVDYRWERRLGGFRKPSPDSPDTALRNASFRAYAAHMRTPEFSAALAEVLAGAALRRTAVMCSETVWWRCHRRLVADSAVLLHGVAVTHLIAGSRPAPHRPTDGARVADGALVYDVPSPQGGQAPALPFPP